MSCCQLARPSSQPSPGKLGNASRRDVRCVRRDDLTELEAMVSQDANSSAAQSARPRHRRHRSSVSKRRARPGEARAPLKKQSANKAREIPRRSPWAAHPGGSRRARELAVRLASVTIGNPASVSKRSTARSNLGPFAGEFQDVGRRLHGHPAMSNLMCEYERVLIDINILAIGAKRQQLPRLEMLHNSSHRRGVLLDQ